MRVFLGLTEVSGYYRGLKAGFEELGVGCTFIDLAENPFGFGGDDAGILVRCIRRLARGRAALPPRARMRRASCLAAEGLARSLLLAMIAATHDVFIFSFNTSFLRYRELPILRLLGKRIIYQYHGSDSRPPYLNGSITPSADDETIDRCIDLVRFNKGRLRAIQRHAHLVVDTPTQGHFHERPFIQWLRVGIATRPVEVPEPARSEPRGDGLVRVLHAPSKPQAKGTDRIREIVEHVRRDGLPIEYREITGRSNREVLAELARCDLALDQMYADYAMPGFATEAAWMGKPVLVGGYAVQDWERALPPELQPPSVYCHPDEVEANLRRLILDRAHREEVGRRCREFVERRWAPRQVAEAYLRLARGDVPPEWWCDPSRIDYLHGCCLPEDRARELIRRVIERGGRSALGLDDKPALAAALEAFATKPKPARCVSDPLVA